jgi:uncharacterized integral membrane protein
MATTDGNPRKRGVIEWVKLIVGLLVAAYAVLFVVLNAQHRSTVWLYGFDAIGTPTLVVIVVTALLTLVTAWVIRKGLHRWVWRGGRAR